METSQLLDDSSGRWAASKTWTLTLLRIVSGLLLFQSGGMKHFGWLGGMPGGRVLEPWSQTWIGGWIEVVGGALLMVGLFTRPVAFILSGMMAVAYFQFHQPGGTWPGQNQGIPAVMLCFACLHVCAMGGGPWSLDAMFGRKTIP